METTQNGNLIKVVKGMPAYLTHVEKIELGKSNIDFLMLNIPPVCNYRCKKCFTRAGSREITNSLTLEELFKVIKDGKKLGAKSVSILGEGEPLFYKHIKEVISFIDKLGMVPIIATNARLLTKEMADFLYEHNTTIGFSLDTLDEKKYNDYCRGNASLAEVLKNIEYARKLYSKKIYTKNGYEVHQLLLHMTVFEKNFKDMPTLREFCGEDIFFDCQPLAYVGDAEQNFSNYSSELTYENYQKEGHIIFPPMVLTKTEKGRYTCGLFYYGLAVSYNGDIMFDTHAIQPKKYIGNIRDLSLAELLSKVKQLRKYFIDNYAEGYCPIRTNSYKDFLKALQDPNFKLPKCL